MKRVCLGRVGGEASVADSAPCGAPYLGSDSVCQYPSDELRRSRQHGDAIADAAVPLEPLEQAWTQSCLELVVHEVVGQRGDVVDVESGEIRLIFLEHVPAKARPPARHEQCRVGYLTRANPLAPHKVCDEQNLGTRTLEQRPVDVDQNSGHLVQPPSGRRVTQVPLGHEELDDDRCPAK